MNGIRIIFRRSSSSSLRLIWKQRGENFIKRPIFQFAGSFVLGEVLALLKGAGAAGIASALWAVILGLALLCPGRLTIKRLLPVLCLLGAFWTGYGRALAERNCFEREAGGIERLAETRAVIEGEISEIQEKETGISLTLKKVRARAGSTEAAFRKLWVFLEDGQGKTLKIGWRVGLRGELKEAERARNPGVFDFGLYARAQGYCGQVYGENLKVLDDSSEIPYAEGIRRIKACCVKILKRVCDPEDLGIFQAVVLGDQSQMDPQIRNMYQRHGISHLLAVSGQHLTILGGSLYLILRRLGLRQRGAGIIGGIAVISYGILTGSSGSAMRAVVMILCLWLGGLLGRTYDSLSAMGLAAVILLWRSPYLIFQSGFQLSFGAVWAIAGPGTALCQMLRAARSWQKTLIISLSVQMVLTPLVIWHYFRHPLYGMILNLLVMPMAAGLIYSGAGAILLGAVGTVPGRMAAGSGHFILRVYESLCGFFEKLPGWSLMVGRPGWESLAIYMAAMAALGVILLWQESRKTGRGENRDGTSEAFRWKCFLWCFGVYGAALLTLQPSQTSGLWITCLDVGQGDGIVIETRAGAILADGGSTSQADLGEECLEPFLESRGIDTIQYALVSHADQDHISGLVYLLSPQSRIRVQNLVLPHLGKGQKDYDQLRQLAKERNTRVLYMDTGSRIRLGDLELICLYGGDPAGSSQDMNRQSPAVELSCGAFHILLTGDMDQEGERQLIRQTPRETWYGSWLLKAAHHGSNTSTSMEFLEAVRPRAAVISYGRDNSYGHPSPEVLKRLGNLKIRTWETGIMGAITIKVKEKGIEISGFLSGEENIEQQKENIQ